MYTNETLGKALEDLTTAYNNFIQNSKDAAMEAMGDTVIAQIKQDAKDHISAELAAQKAALEQAIENAKAAINNSSSQAHTALQQAAATASSELTSSAEAKKLELSALIQSAEQAAATASGEFTSSAEAKKLELAALIQRAEQALQGKVDEAKNYIDGQLTAALQGIEESINTKFEHISGDISALVDESKCRNLLDVLGIRSVHSDEPASKDELKRAMKRLHDKINADGQADWHGLRLGDYLDLPELNDGTTTYKWRGEYKNLRIMISAFNLYKNAGYTENKKNHIVFTFRNCVLTRQMNDSNTNSGGYSASKLAAYLDGGFKSGLEAVLGNYFYTPARLLSVKNDFFWKFHTVFLPTEREVWGSCVFGEQRWDGGYLGQIPIFRDSALYKVKRHNGGRHWWWLASPSFYNNDSFCNCYSNGRAHHNNASISSGGVAPAFCVS